MIIEIPTANDFAQANLSLLNLAWSSVVDCLRDIDVADWAHEYENEHDRKAAHQHYWERVQPVMGNGLALIQQAIEMAIKGRIAAVSPFLLIIRDARDYPKDSDKADVPFSAFRSLDAADLVRVHNTVCAERLPEEFKSFWDDIRRQRNVIMHTVSKEQRIAPEEIIGHILTAHSLLSRGEPWHKQRIGHRRTDEHSAFPRSREFEYGSVLIELGLALARMKPADAKRHFGFDKKARAYHCPHCYYEAERKFQRDEVPPLAQLRPNEPGSKFVYCFVCDQTFPVLREDCEEDGCPSNVISDHNGTASMCLVCTHYQSGLVTGLRRRPGK
jgi:hypothetical protein